jgi:hypothetical protein
VDTTALFFSRFDYSVTRNAKKSLEFMENAFRFHPPYQLKQAFVSRTPEAFTLLCGV